MHVLDDGRAITISAGLRFAGIGDPQFTPDRSVTPGGDAAEDLAGARLASALRDQRTAGTPVDIAMATDVGGPRDEDRRGASSWPVTSTTNRWRSSSAGTRLRVEGSTGGSGLRAIEGKYPDPIEASGPLRRP